LLSDLWTFISNVIYEGEQSFNSTSTPSRFNFTLLRPPPPLLHLSSTPPPPPLASSSPPTSPGDPVTSPSPLLRDVGSVNIAPAPSQARMLPQPPLPFLKGCGQLSLARRRTRGGKKTKEWEAPLVSYKIRAMTFVVVRFRDPSPYPPH